MTMEGTGQLGDLNVLKADILNLFRSEGLTERAGAMFRAWGIAKVLEMDTVGSMEARLIGELDFLDFYIELGRNKVEILESLKELEVSAFQEDLLNLVEQIRTKIKVLDEV